MNDNLKSDFKYFIHFSAEKISIYFYTTIVCFFISFLDFYKIKIFFFKSKKGKQNIFINFKKNPKLLKKAHRLGFVYTITLFNIIDVYN
jgi:hypothetical protein